MGLPVAMSAADPGMRLGCIFHPFLFSPLKFDATRARANGVYYLDKCIFHPVMFSPRQTLEGVVERPEKTGPG
jgi:hypothetical protein